VDSGVHASHPHVQGVAGGVGIDDDGRVHDDFVDRLGHGTAVTAVLREKVPTADLWAVKVFDRQLATTGIALIAALAWARQTRMHFVNLSLGTTNIDHESGLRDEVRRSIDAGIAIVAAGPVDNHRWLPGALPGVVRVMLDMSMPRDRCRPVRTDDGELLFAASGYPRPIPGVPPDKNLKGLSFAVANVTGLLAQAWPEWRSVSLLQSDRSL
jgi:hypothetical protein